MSFSRGCNVYEKLRIGKASKPFIIRNMRLQSFLETIDRLAGIQGYWPIEDPEHIKSTLRLFKDREPEISLTMGNESSDSDRKSNKACVYVSAGESDYKRLASFSGLYVEYDGEIYPICMTEGIESIRCKISIKKNSDICSQEEEM